MGEIQYIWAEPTSPQQQVALSSICQAMLEKECMAIARWVSRDGMDPKMGVLVPGEFEKVDCLLWSPVLIHSSQFLSKLNNLPFFRRCHSQTMFESILSIRLTT